MVGGLHHRGSRFTDGQRFEERQRLSDEPELAVDHSLMANSSAVGRIDAGEVDNELAHSGGDGSLFAASSVLLHFLL